VEEGVRGRQVSDREVEREQQALSTHLYVFKHLSTLGSAGAVAAVVIYKELGSHTGLTIGTLLMFGYRYTSQSIGLFLIILRPAATGDLGRRLELAVMVLLLVALAATTTALTVFVAAVWIS
jgi:hypothetical protein